MQGLREQSALSPKLKNMEGNMNKNEIKRYLENQREESLQILLKQRHEEEKREREFETAGAFITTDLVAMDKAMHTLLETLKPYKDTVYRNSGTTKYRHSNSRLYDLARTLECITNEDDYLTVYAKELNRNYNFIQESERKYEIARAKVNTEFRKIVGNISKMNAKEASEYIVGLGFILPDTDTPQVSSNVLAPIDVKMLQSLRDAMHCVNCNHDCNEDCGHPEKTNEDYVEEDTPVGTDVENEDWHDNTEA